MLEADLSESRHPRWGRMDIGVAQVTSGKPKKKRFENVTWFFWFQTFGKTLSKSW